MGFVGENGAGKTTTMGCILNTLQYDSGNIEVLGQTMSDANTALREEIGVVYDGDNFPEHFTVAQLERVMQDVYRRWDNYVVSATRRAISFGQDEENRHLFSWDDHEAGHCGGLGASSAIIDFG